MKFILLGILAVSIILFVLAIPTTILWNWVMNGVFGIPFLNLFQMWGLL